VPGGRLEPVLQSEAAECGLACLAMVCRQHGDRVTLRELRRCFPLSLKGATLTDLVRIAGRLGLRARALRCELEDLRRLALPAILHWDLCHFVVLARASRARLVILDPATGKRRLRLREASPHFTGVALELAPAEEFAASRREPAVSLRDVIGPVRGLGRALALVGPLSLALQALVVLGPFYLQWVVDQVLVSADRDLLAVLAAGFTLVLVLQAAIGALRGFTVAQVSAALALQWTGNVFAHLLRLPLEFFHRRHLGDIVSRLSSVRAIQRTLTTAFVEALVDGLMAGITLLVMLLYSRTLAALSIGAVAAYAALRTLTFPALRERSARQLVAGARQQSHLLESLRGMQSIRIAGVEAERAATQANLMTDTTNQELGLARLGLGVNTARTLLFGIERIATVWLGARLTLEGTFSAGMLVAFLAYKDQFAARVSTLVDKAVELSMLGLHAERLADIVLAEPDPAATAVPPPGPPPDGRIELRDVAYRYADGEPWVLEHVDLTVEDGEAVAIVGASGCGKTTLVKLLAGVLRPTHGRVRVGGRDPAAGGMAGIVAAVMQDDQLFAGSIADNIAFGDAVPDAARIEAAARIAGVHDEIAALPMGYGSLVGDMGTSLSGGQKQRVLLARALYRRPRVLLLDEATSHLDVRRERLVNAAVRRLPVTRIVVAHRPETIAAADRVLLLGRGRILGERRRPVPRQGPAAGRTSAA
jgi:ATP-binding cassette subfamily B protein RaxB